MNRRTFIGAFAWVWALTRSGLERLGQDYKGAAESNQNSQRGKTWAAFEIADLNAKREGAKRPYLEFLRAPTLFAGLYALPAGADDRQPVHKEDEIYYVVGGRATLRLGDEDQTVQPGSVIYIKAGVSHRFHSIKEELTVLVFFSTAAPGDGLKLNQELSEIKTQ